MDITPLSLLERLQKKATPDDWARLVRLCTPLLYFWARGNGLQEPDAADLVQDVFLLMIDKLAAFRHQGPGSFRGWLRIVALNKVRQRLRCTARPVTGAEGPLAEVSAPDPLEEYWEAEYRRHLVSQALRIMRAEFEPTTWKACWEHTVNDKSAAEVGAELGLTPGAVRAARFRVLTRLRQELRDIVG